MQDLPGKTAFVTGGASGYRTRIAKALLGAGHEGGYRGYPRRSFSRPRRRSSARQSACCRSKLDVTDRAAYARAADAARSALR